MPKVCVLLVGNSPHQFSLFQSPLERIGCQCYFAESPGELCDVLRHTQLDIVLGLSSHQSLFDVVALLEGLCVTMFHMLPVE